MHSSGSMARKFGPSWKQSTGHTSTQSMYLHLMQFSVTTKVIQLPLGRRVIVPWAADCGESALAWRLEALVEGVKVVAFLARHLVLEVAAQREVGTAEGDVVPGNVSCSDECHLEALGSGTIKRGRQLRAKEHVHLLGMQHVHDREQRPDGHLGERF